MSHTYAIMEVSQDTYDEIREKLIEAGYRSHIDASGVPGSPISATETLTLLAAWAPQ